VQTFLETIAIQAAVNQSINGKVEESTQGDHPKFYNPLQNTIKKHITILATSLRNQK
jgi:hypothetical protein